MIEGFLSSMLKLFAICSIVLPGLYSDASFVLVSSRIAIFRVILDDFKAVPLPCKASRVSLSRKPYRTPRPRESENPKSDRTECQSSKNFQECSKVRLEPQSQPFSPKVNLKYPEVNLIRFLFCEGYLVSRTFFGGSRT